MSLEELQSLKAEISSEILKRTGGDDARISKGTYTVGTDIQAGTYDLTVIKPESESSDSTWIYLSADRDAYDNGDIDSCLCVDDGDTVTLNLVNNIVLEIQHFGGVMEKITPSWAPCSDM
jgi:hypothetical protein